VIAYSIVFKEQARTDIAKSVQWYEERQVGLGDRFLSDLNKLLIRISKNPFLYQIRRNNIRLGLLKTFPFLVAYEAEEKQLIIYKVIHSHRHPAKRYR
jgi:hypothetical protein